MKIDDKTSIKISWLKSLMILEVVYIHMGDNYVKPLVENQDSSTSFYRFIIYLLSDTISSTAVPLFFVISGLLFFNNFLPTHEIYIKKIKSRVATLAIPYLFWNFMFLLFKVTVQLTPFLKDKLSGESKRVLDYTAFDYFNAFAGWTTYPLSYQFWFIRDLMILVLVSPVIWIASKYISWLLPLIFIILWAAGADRIININYASWIFFSIGCLIAQERAPLKISSSLQHLLVAAFFGGSLLLAVDHVYHLGLPLISDKLLVILGVPAIWYGADIFLKINWLKSPFLFMTPFAFFVYAAHEPILGMTMHIIGKISFLSNTHEKVFTLYIAYPILLTVMLLLLGVFVKNQFPKLYSLATGGRE
jgi:surface polysaccharide O-acyltransferase-like enzyme